MKNCHKYLQKFMMKILKHLTLIFRKILSLYTSFHNLGNPFKEKENNSVQIAT